MSHFRHRVAAAALALAAASLLGPAAGAAHAAAGAAQRQRPVRSTNSGTSFVKINSASDCAGIGFGKAATGATYPTIFIWGTVNGTRGLFRSTDTGNTWLRVNDWAHQYGSNGAIVVGDMNTFGVVYMTTAGRGLAVGRP